MCIFLGGLLWAPSGPYTMFDLSKMHIKLGTGTFKVGCWALLIVEGIFLYTKSSKEDEAKHLMIAAIAFHIFLAMSNVTLNVLFLSKFEIIDILH